MKEATELEKRNVLYTAAPRHVFVVCNRERRDQSQQKILGQFKSVSSRCDWVRLQKRVTGCRWVRSSRHVYFDIESIQYTGRQLIARAGLSRTLPWLVDARTRYANGENDWGHQQSPTNGRWDFRIIEKWLVSKNQSNYWGKERWSSR